MAVGLPIGTVRLMKRRNRLLPMIKVSHHGTCWQRWKSASLYLLETHHGPLEAGDRVYARDGNPLNIARENLIVGKPIDNLQRMLISFPHLEEKRRRAQSRAVEKSNKQRTRHKRSIGIRYGQFYAVSHATQTIIFVPCRTKHQAERFKQDPAYQHLELVAVRGSKLAEECKFYDREIPDEGQAWVQKRTLEKQNAIGATASENATPNTAEDPA